MSFIKKLFKGKKLKQEVIADFHTTIIRVDDNFISSSSIILDEILMGNIFSLKEITVTDAAEISGNVTSRTSAISGKVFGDVISMEYAEIKSTAIISGNIRSKAISVEPGAVINGSMCVEGEIDERELLEKVENRLPLNALKEHTYTTYMLPEETSA